MSRFFRGALSSSDSSDNDEIEEPVSRPTIRDFAYPSDSDDEGPKRVVVNAKDRKFEELKELIKAAKNQKKIKDMAKLLTTFENLCKTYEKTKSVIMRQGLSTPRFYIRALVEIEDYVNEQWEDKDGRKALSKVNAKGLTTLRQKVRKYNKEIDGELAAYRVEPDPVGYSSAEENVAGEEEGESGAESVPEVKPKPKAIKKDVKKALISDDESDEESESDEDHESDWGSDEIDSESSDSDIDLEGKQMEDLRRFFLKKEFKEGGDKDDDKRKKRRDQKEKRNEERGEKDDDDDNWVPVQTKEERSRQLFDPKTEINGEVVLKKLIEIVSTRGRVSTNRKNHVRSLQDLFKIADDHKLGAGILTKILFAIISALFELNVRMSDSMDFESWMKTFEAIKSLFKMLDESDNVTLSIKNNEDNENLTNDSEDYRVHGSLPLTVLRLDSELTKIFQNADCHSTEYIDKLKGEKDLCSLIETAQLFMENPVHKDCFLPEEMWQIYMLRIEHLYYKFAPEENGESEAAMNLLQELCTKVYSFPEAKRERQRSMLCQIYHHALHDRWHRAKDLMLMSHLQAIVDHSDVSTQILYNRTICQLGLCAFRHGFIKEAHQGLSEIQNTQRVKELLAQGIPPRQSERTPEQEKIERSRQIPYHMHINIELMECVYLICSMLLEIPNLACHEYDTRRRLLSRSFHYQLKFSEKSPLIGPPENTREHVVAASRAMLNGDWEQCVKYIVNEKMNAKVWNLFRNADGVKEMVVDRIKEETLRTYLLMYSTVYQTVSLGTLRQLFSLPKEAVHAVISKMIIQEELSATLDEPSDCLIMHRIEPSRMQLLALHLSEKLSALAESTEQIVEPRSGRQNYSTGYYMKGQGEEKGRRGNFQDRRGGDRYNQDGARRQWNAGQGQGGRRQRPGGRL